MQISRLSTALAIILNLTISQPSSATIYMGDIRNLVSAIKQEFEPLTPLWEAIYAESGYLENFYRFGVGSYTNDGSLAPSAKRLVTELFFLQHDDVTFALTAHPYKPARYFTPKHIAHIISVIEKYRPLYQELHKQTLIATQQLKDLQAKFEQEQNSEDFKKLLDQINQPSVTKVQRQTLGAKLKALTAATAVLIKKKEIELKQLVDSKIFIQCKAELNKIIEPISMNKQDATLYYEAQKVRFEEKIEKSNGKIASIDVKLTEKDLAPETITLLQNTKKNLAYKIKLRKQEIARLTQRYNEQDKEFARAKTILVESISAALHEEGTLFPTYHTTWIMLGVLWHLAEQKKDFLDYLQTLNQTIPLIKDPEFIKQQSFLSDSYTKKDYVVLVTKTDIQSLNVEELMFSYLGFNTFLNPLPPRCHMRSWVPFTNSTGKTYLFPDCGETSLLNFLNALLYNNETQSFNMEILQKLGASEKLITFYNNHKTVKEMADTYPLHADWAKVVSSLNDVHYVNKSICDINAGLRNFGINNMLAVFKNIFTNIQSFEELKSKLVSADITMNFTMPNTNNRPQIIEFTLQKLQQKPFTIQWLFDERHFEIHYPQATPPHAEKFRTFLEATIKMRTDNELSYDYTKYLTLAAVYESHAKLWKKNDRIFAPYVFLLQQITPNKILSALANIDQFDFNAGGKQQFACNLYGFLPKQDRTIQIKALAIIMSNKWFDPNTAPFNHLSDVATSVAIKIILENKDQQFFPWVGKVLPSLKDKDQRDVLQKQLSELQNPKKTD